MDKKKLIEINPDFVVAPKFNNSLSKLIQNYPDGVPVSIICKALLITQEEFDKIHQSAIMKLKLLMNK